MDAKPHRPARPFAAQSFRDENVPVNSSVSISKQPDAEAVRPPYVNAGGFKAATKRSVFGDLSNTSHSLHQNAPTNGIAKHAAPLSKSALKMASSKDANKENAGLAVKNARTKSAFHHPPQRPINNARLALNVQLPSQDEHRAKAATKQTGPRKTHVVYHDNQTQQSQTLTRKFTSQPQLKLAEVPALRRSQSKHIMHDIHFESTIDDDIIEVAYEDVRQDFVRQHAAETNGWMNVQRPAGSCINANMEPLQPMPPSPPQQLLADHEECWDEDDDEELYEDLGYTTIHSYRSYGDNTTGVTSLMAPKRTAKVLKELDEARLYVDENRPLNEVDDEVWDVTMVAEYGDEIFEYMRTLEERMIPNPSYMGEVQVDIQWSMRSILMDWLVQVHNRFALLSETLFLTVNLIDRFLSTKIISLGKLQLVGATAIFVAAKYEEIDHPSVQEIVFMVDGGYTADEILKAERFMLTMLDFELGYPGPMSFLRRISKADDYDLETRTLAKYFLEVTIMDERFVGCTSSYIAAGAHSLARMILRKGTWVSRDPLTGQAIDPLKLRSLWTPLHVHFSGYTWAQLKPLVAMILECCHVAKTHHSAVYEKYTDRRFKKSSIFVQEELARGFRLPFQMVIPRLSLCSPTVEHSAQIRFPRPESNVLIAT